MLMPNQTRPIERRSASTIDASVRPAGIGGVLQRGGNFACDLACNGDKRCMSLCSQGVGVGADIGDLLMWLL
jgi:hypothetical protein